MVILKLLGWGYETPSRSEIDHQKTSRYTMVHKTFLFVLIVLSWNVQATRQTSSVIYDARLVIAESKPSVSEAVLINKRVRPVAIGIWRKTDGCKDEFTVVDVATGSFTKPRSNQRAFLYRLCETGHGFAVNGIVILEAGQVVAHVVYSGGWENAIGALPDINGNGVNELILVNGGTNQGMTWGNAAILELTNDGVIKFGRASTYEDDCGTLTDKKKVTAYVLRAVTGVAPVFYRDTYTSHTCESGSWKTMGSQNQLMLDPDEIEYRRIR